MYTAFFNEIVVRSLPLLPSAWNEDCFFFMLVHGLHDLYVQMELLTRKIILLLVYYYTNQDI